MDQNNMTEPQKVEVLSEGEAPVAAAADIAEKQQRDIELLKVEAADYKDRYVRQLAEMDNVRKRTERERLELRKFGAESLVRELLPILDGFERVESSSSKEASAETMIQGLVLLKKSLFDVLAKHGLRAIESQEATFDPNFHQAIQRVEKDGVDEEIVLDVFAKGYFLHDRLIRPAMVSVGVPAEPKDN